MLTLLTLLTFLSSTDAIVDGYSDRLSVRPGDSLTLYLNGSEVPKGYNLKLYDLANNAVATFKVQLEPQGITNKKAWETGYGYKVSAKFVVPDLKSGVYLWEGKIPLVVKAKSPKIVVLYSSNTENAYCPAGGKSLYGFNSTGSKMASKVSFLRPIPLPKHSQEFLRWLTTQNLIEAHYRTSG